MEQKERTLIWICSSNRSRFLPLGLPEGCGMFEVQGLTHHLSLCYHSCRGTDMRNGDDDDGRAWIKTVMWTINHALPN